MSKMNTDKSLREKFTYEKDKYPIWYYKELEPVDIDYVIMFLLTTDKFIVDIEGVKIEITFGKNKKNEIGNCTTWNDFKRFDRSMTSYETIQKAFTIGKWYLISDKDTTDEYKEKFRKEKEKYEKEYQRKEYLDILARFLEVNRDKITKEEYEEAIKYLNGCDFESLEEFWKKFCKNINKK